MRIAELSLRNYRVFEEVDLELPSRVIGIFGPNGSGKSTLVESILFALYGRARTGRKEIRTHGVLTDCEVLLVFEHGGSRYEIRRRIRGRNHATEAELFVGSLQLASGVGEVDAEVQRLLRMDQQVFRSSVFAEQKQLDAFSDVTAGRRKEMVLRLLGIRPVDDARAAARRDARTAKQSADRLVGAVADVGELESRLKDARAGGVSARAIARSAAGELRSAAAAAKAAAAAFDRVDRARQKLEKLTIGREGAREQRKELAERRDGLTERLERSAAEVAELPGLRDELASLDGVRDRLTAAERLAAEIGRLAKLEDALMSIRPPESKVVLEELEVAEADAVAARKASAGAGARRDHEHELLRAAEAALARAAQADPSQPCPTCGRELGADFPAYMKHCKAERAAAKKHLTASERSVREASLVAERAESRLAAAMTAGEEVRRTEGERERLFAEATSVRNEVTRLRAPFGDEEPDLEVIRSGAEREKELATRVARLSQLDEQRTDTQRDLAEAETRLAELDARLSSMDEEAAGLSFDPEEHARLHRERDATAEALERGREAERAAAEALAEVETVIGGLEGEIRQAREILSKIEEIRVEARYLARVSMLLDGFRDHLVARIGPELSREAEAIFRDLTGHEYDDLRIHDEDLRIEIADGDAYFGIERFSGSEADLANLALRVAISSHLSRMSGTDVGMMVLDEVLGSLDVERKDLLVQTMGRLAGRFHQLFVITHAEQVKDQFPAAIEVRKSRRRRSVASLV